MKIISLLFFFVPLAGFCSLVPDHELVKTKSGIPIYFFKSPNVPIFQIELFFDNGCLRDPKGKSGLTKFYSAMVTRGVPDKNELQINERLDFLAAQIGVSSQDDKTTVSAIALNDKVDETLDLLFQMLTRPTLPNSAFQRIKSNHIDEFKQIKDSASEILGRALPLVLYNNTKWGIPCDGLKQDFETISLKDMRAIQKDFFSVNGLQVLVIGGKNKSEILEKLTSRLDQLSSAQAKNKKRSDAFYKKGWEQKENEIFLIDRSGISESYLGFAELAPKRNIPEYYDLVVASQILGGSFRSRINYKLREQLNLTYSAQGGFSLGKETGDFSVVTSTKASDAGRVYVEVQKMMQELATGSFSAEEVSLAKDYLVGSFPLSLSSLYSIASMFVHGVIDGERTGFLDEYEDKIKAVNAASLKVAVQKYFDPSKLKVLVVGPKSLIQKSFRENKVKAKLVGKNVEEFF